MAVSAGCAGSGQSPGDDAEGADPSSSTSEQSSTPTSTPTSTAEATGPCALLGAATIRGLAGERLEGQEGTVAGSDLPACLGDPGIRRQLEEAAQLIERGRTIPSGRACGLFTDMLELHGGVPAGSDYAITYIPSDQDPQGASVQACVDGTFTTVAGGRPDLKPVAELEAALEAALQEALAGTASS